MKFIDVPLFVKAACIKLDDPWQAILGFETTLYTVPLFGRITVVADHRTEFRIMIDNEPARFRPESLKQFLGTLSPDGFWIVASGMLQANGPEDGELVAYMRGIEAGMLPWCWALDASDILFVDADVETMGFENPDDDEEQQPGQN